MAHFLSLEDCLLYADRIKSQLPTPFQPNARNAFVYAFAYLGAQLEDSVVGAEQATLKWIDLFQHAHDVVDKVQRDKFDNTLSATFSFIIYCVSRNMENQTDFHRQLLIRVNGLFKNDRICFQKLNSLASSNILFIWDVLHFANNFETQKLALLFFINVLKYSNEEKQQELLTSLPCEESIKNVFQIVIANSANNLDNQIFSILNAYNETKQPPRNIITFPCAGVVIEGKYQFEKPNKCEQFWISINYDPWMITFEACAALNSQQNETTFVKIPIKSIIFGANVINIHTEGSISLNGNFICVNKGRSYQYARIQMFDTNLELQAMYKHMLKRRSTISYSNSVGQQFSTNTNEKMYGNTTNKNSRFLPDKDNAETPHNVTKANLNSGEKAEEKLPNADVDKLNDVSSDWDADDIFQSDGDLTNSESEAMQVTCIAKVDNSKEKTTSANSSSLLEKDNAVKPNTLTKANLKSGEVKEQKLANAHVDKLNDVSSDWDADDVFQNDAVLTNSESESMQLTCIDEPKETTTSTLVNINSRSLLDKDNAEKQQNSTKCNAKSGESANTDELTESSSWETFKKAADSNAKANNTRKYTKLAVTTLPPTIRRVKTETTAQTTSKNNCEVIASTSRQRRTRKRKLRIEDNMFETSSDNEQLSTPKRFKKNSKTKTVVIAENNIKLSDARENGRKQMKPKVNLSSDQSCDNNVYTAAEANTSASNNNETVLKTYTPDSSTDSKKYNTKKHTNVNRVCSVYSDYSDSDAMVCQSYRNYTTRHISRSNLKMQFKRNVAVVKTERIDKNLKFFKNGNFHRYRIAKITKSLMIKKTFNQYLSKSIFANDKLETLNCYTNKNNKLNIKNNTKKTNRKRFSKEKEAEYFETLQFC